MSERDIVQPQKTRLRSTIFENVNRIGIQGAGRREKSKKGALWEVFLLFSRRWDPLPEVLKLFWRTKKLREQSDILAGLLHFPRNHYDDNLS